MPSYASEMLKPFSIWFICINSLPCMNRKISFGRQIKLTTFLKESICFSCVSWSACAATRSFFSSRYSQVSSSILSIAEQQNFNWYDSMKRTMQACLSCQAHHESKTLLISWWHAKCTVFGKKKSDKIKHQINFCNTSFCNCSIPVMQAPLFPLLSLPVTAT